MAMRQRDHWTLILALSFLLMVSVAAGKFASIPERARLALNVGEEVQIPVSRLLPHPVSLSIEFSRAPGSKPIELGDWISRSGTGYIEFDLPGAPIKILVSGLDRETIFEALPSGQFSTSRDGKNRREFVVFQEDGESKRFPWPPLNAARPNLPMGSSIVKVKILEVTSGLAGEQVAMVVDAPLSAKGSQPNYFFLGLVALLWPVVALALFIYALLLPWSFRKLMIETNKARSD